MRELGRPRGPSARATVALLPADVRKIGSRFDLAIAVALLGVRPSRSGRRGLERIAWLAELGLDGRLRPVRGVLPSVAALRAAGVRRRGRRAGERRRGGARAGHGRPVRRRPARGDRGAHRRPAAAAARGRTAGRRPMLRARILPTSPGRRWPSGRSRSPPRAGITCSCRARRARARRCWPSGCPGCCRALDDAAVARGDRGALGGRDARRAGRG